MKLLIKLENFDNYEKTIRKQNSFNYGEFPRARRSRRSQTRRTILFDEEAFLYKKGEGEFHDPAEEGGEGREGVGPQLVRMNKLLTDIYGFVSCTADR